MTQINCPVCTFLNDIENSHCECCDSPLRLDVQENPLEKQFMDLTGEERSIAKEYLEVTRNNLDNAVALFFEDKERGVTNQEVLNQQNQFMNMYANDKFFIK